MGTYRSRKTGRAVAWTCLGIGLGLALAMGLDWFGGWL
jgi:hypothetical protein